MYQRFLFFGGSKHGERISVQQKDAYFLVYVPVKKSISENGVEQTSALAEEIYHKRKWHIDGNTEFVFVLSSLLEEQSEEE